MHAIRHYVVTLAGLAVIGGIAGIGPALWTAAALLVSIGANSTGNFLAERNTAVALRRARNQAASGAGRESVAEALQPGGFATAMVSISLIGSMLLALAGAAVLFVRYGWLPMTGFIILFILYFAVRESDHGRTRRHVKDLRATLSGFIAQREADLITDEQLLTRSFDALDHDLSGNMHAIPACGDQLLAAAGMPTGRHRTMLSVLAAYFESVEEHAVRYSELHQAVRRQLGLPKHP